MGSFAYFKARYRNNRAEAESKIEQALSIKPEDATLIEIKGDIYHLFSESDEAVIWWVKALELGGPTQRIQQKLSETMIKWYIHSILFGVYLTISILFLKVVVAVFLCFLHQVTKCILIKVPLSEIYGQLEIQSPQDIFRQR